MMHILYTPTYTEPTSDSFPELPAIQGPLYPFQKQPNGYSPPKIPFPNLGRISSFQMRTRTAIFFLQRLVCCGDGDVI